MSIVLIIFLYKSQVNLFRGTKSFIRFGEEFEDLIESFPNVRDKKKTPKKVF